jgi:signal transduction histidine kinase
MVTLVALILSIILQFISAVVAFSLTKVTRYNVSWIFISISLLLLAIRRLSELIPILYSKYYEDVLIIDQWIGIITSVLIAAGIFIVRKIFNQLKEAERIRKSSERRVFNAIILTEERERQRFAKELHDGLGPIMSTIKMSISALNKKNLDEHGSAVVQNLSNVIDQGISEIKEISNSLSPHVLNNFGLTSALSNYIEKITSSKIAHIDFTSNLGEQRFHSNVESVMYRIACELIHNTIKHASASQIVLKLNRTNDLLVLQYSDDGIGFNYNKDSQQESKGMGYYNIYSRLELVNGQIEIDTAPGKGFRCDIYVKIKTGKHHEQDQSSNS